eukprot:NODE_4670_length_562_cov_11.021442_g3407_i0.p4 GENE.NODE_4670_length_562_cov_11.021442_g3407_i0~~NODE_4670_length_562_cov_11.021442_g3407_i0.p4  ORF type:complete len:55 (-),score=5.95 NODE_4670_length_562_cov_11.021442_g3407_i0:316-480(-)
MVPSVSFRVSPWPPPRPLFRVCLVGAQAHFVTLRFFFIYRLLFFLFRFPKLCSP